MIVFIVKISSLAVLTGDKTHRKQTHSGLRVGGDQLNVQQRRISNVGMMRAGFFPPLPAGVTAAFVSLNLSTPR